MHQTDHYYVARYLWTGVGGDPRAFARLRKRAFADPVGTARRIRQGNYPVAHQHRETIATHLERVAPDLHGDRQAAR